MDGSLYSGKLNHYTTALPPTRKSDTQSADHPTVYAKLATSDDDLDVATALRYEAYAAVGYLGKLKSQRYSDKYDLQSTSKTLILYHERVAVASARVCALDRGAAADQTDSIPAYEMFGPEIESYLKSLTIAGGSGRAIEVTRLSRHPDFARSIMITQALFRMIGYLILHLEAHVMLAAITTNHVPFYRRMGFSLIAEPRDYPGLDVQTALMACACQSHTPIRGLLSPISALSRHDDIYGRFLDGAMVAVPPETIARKPVPVPN